MKVPAPPQRITKSSVMGTGIDLVENERMRKVLERWGNTFKGRVFLPREQAYCDTRSRPWQHYAGRLAVKEAVSKAFGTGMTEHISWLDIEVVRHHSSGAPSVRLSDKGQYLADQRGVRRILVSLSHTHQYTVAQALLLGEPE